MSTLSHIVSPRVIPTDESKLLSTRNTLYAVKKESTPYEYEEIGDTDFLPVLEGADATTGRDSVENKEIRGRLDKRPARPTTKNGSVTIPVYFKGSDDPTQPPWFQDLIDACFGTETAPFAGTEKTTSGNAAPLIVEGTPTTTSLDVTCAQATFADGDALVIDTSVAGDGSRVETAVIDSVTFVTDHDAIVLVTALANAPAVGNDVELVSRITIDGSPGLVKEDLILVDVSNDGSGMYEAVIVLEVVGGTTEQEVKVWPYLSAEPPDGSSVLGGRTNKTNTSGHTPVTVSVFKDCLGQDGIRKDFAGCRPNMTLQNASTGQIPELHFAMDAVKWRTSSTDTNLDTLGIDPDLGPEHDAPICLGSIVTLGSHKQLIHTQNLSFDLGQGVGKRNSMVADSGFRSSRYNERQVTGSFDLDLVDDSQYQAWEDSESFPLVVMFGDETQTLVVLIPYAKRTGVEESDSEGAQIQNIPFAADPPDGLGPVVFGFFPPVI